MLRWIGAYFALGAALTVLCFGLIGGKAWFPLAVVSAPFSYLGIAGAIFTAPMYAVMAWLVSLAGRRRMGFRIALLVVSVQAGAGCLAWLAYFQSGFEWEWPRSLWRAAILAAWLAGLAGLVRLGRLRDAESQ